MKRINSELEENIVRDYLNNISTMSISRKYKISRSTVQKYLIKHGVKLHHTITTRIFNHNFFSTYTKESCYWAGFILADGYLRKNRNSLEILLHKRDAEHLLNFTKLLGFETDIRIFHENTCKIIICSDKIKQGLEENFEIHNKKSLDCFISEKIPQKFLSHYIRGYFDGDGTFSNENRFQFIGTYKTCDFIREYLKYNGVIKLNGNVPQIGVKTIKNSLYFIKYSKNLSKKIFETLFADSTNEIRLKRKYEKILEYVSLV